MIKSLLALDGVVAIAKFRDDGAYIEGYGMMAEEQLHALTGFAHDYKRIVQGNADQLSMFTGLPGWTPPSGWVVRGQSMTVCSVANLVCILDHTEGSLNQVMGELSEVARH